MSYEYSLKSASALYLRGFNSDALYLNWYYFDIFGLDKIEVVLNWEMKGFEFYSFVVTKLTE